MKFLILMVTIFTGSQAYVLRDEQYPYLAQLNQKIVDYFNNITMIVNEKIDHIRRLDFSQSLLDQLHNAYLKVSQHLNYLQSKLPPEVTKTYDLAVEVSMGLVEKDSVLGKVGPCTEALHRVLAMGAKGLNPRVTEKLKKQLEKVAKELAPLVQTLQDQLEEFQTSLEPCTGNIQEMLKESIERANQQLPPYVSLILYGLENYAKIFNRWLDSSNLQAKESINWAEPFQEIDE
ncbi:apolipoprotein A-IV-like isoform X2 [Python bivittatus]|uniref:Apolipoprotein A-IV-like isoform X2 n=1 Tax=Python bivittatus TaxID=176946 RepID=A0A9F5J6H1_PYTBI|nr:apolipoprotein A-IV-like isoform X2 [Python bivittatus]